MYCTNHDATVATSKVGVVSAGSSSLASESGDSLRDSISDSCATYFVNSSKLTLPSSSVGGWGKWVELVSVLIIIGTAHNTPLMGAGILV